jgi:hypothetical protein
VPGVIDGGDSTTGDEEGAAVGAGLGGAAAFCFGQLGLDTAFLVTALALALALTLGWALLGAALTAFFATLRALPVFLALAFTLTFEGRAFFLATLFLAAGRLAFATGRFFDLLFFAMITLLLEIVRTRCESSPEKVCCHLCVTLESVTWIA